MMKGDDNKRAPMPRIEFWFDYISHNAYLAWCALRPLAARHGHTVDAQPVVFAGLLNHYGTKGPAELPAKHLWMIKNVLRKAQLEGITINAPASHPFNPLLSLRATLAIEDPKTRSAFIDGMFKAVWVDRKDPSADQTVAMIADQAGEDGERLVALAHAPDTKDALHQQTRLAIRKGIFGVPSMLTNAELFWGYDDLQFLELHLSGQDPLSSEQLAPWKRIRPSAKR